MPAISLSTTAEKVADTEALIQNLGTDIIYVDNDESVTSDTGVVIEPGDSIVVGAGHDYYAVSAGTSDVRVLAGVVSAPQTLSNT